MKLKELFEQSAKKLYHVTLTKNVDKIKDKGIIPLQKSNWVKAGSKERYGDGSIFAFENMTDAIRWGLRWDWDLNKNMGTGKVSIITFNDGEVWNVDDSDPIGQAGAKGKWLKRRKMVDPKNIQSAEPITKDMVKLGVVTEDKIRAKQYSPEELKELPDFSRSVAESAYKISSGDKHVAIDNENGLGSVPYNQEILYNGFVVMMKCSDFLELALSDEGHQDETSGKMVEFLKQGYSLGSPWLTMLFDDKHAPVIYGHEGRGRMKAIIKYLGDIVMPVQVNMSNGLKNRDITPKMIEMVKDGRIFPEQWKKFKSPPDDEKFFIIGKGKIKDVIK